mgnify:CR=1 FL=1
MQFIHITGKQLTEIINDGELHVEDLHAAGIYDHTVVRINPQGDIEVRRPDRWDVIGGLLGNFNERLHNKLGMDWA